MINSLPIVLIQRGAGMVTKNFTNSYVNYTIAQARISNPEAEIVVIGDEACRASLLGYESVFVSVEKFEGAWAEVKANYVHLSANTAAFESFAMARWLILQAWMKESGHDRVFQMDTDVMLYATLDEVVEANGSAIMWASCGSGHCTLTSRQGLDALCDAIRKGVTDPIESARLQKWRGDSGDNISDMTFIAELSRKLPPGSVLELAACDPIFDHNINIYYPPEGRFVMEGGIKKVHFDGLHAFCTREDGTPQRFASLHFQGYAKKHMCSHLACDPDNPIHRGIIRTLQSNQNALQAAARAEETNEKLASRLGEIRSLSETMRHDIRHLESSSWLRVGTAMRLTSAGANIAKCEEIRKKVCGLAPKSGTSAAH